MMVGFMKPDYLTETAAVIGLYYFYNPDTIRKKGFRNLTVLLAASIIYDLIFVFTTDFADSESSNDYREYNVRLFCLRLCYVSLVWRVSALQKSNLSLGDFGGNFLQTIAKLCDLVQAEVRGSGSPR